MTISSEFKEFALKGNVMDLAIGVIIGAAFARLVDSMVGDLIMPLVAAVIGKIDFSNLFVVLGTIPPGTASTLDALKKAGVPVFAYGQFITVSATQAQGCTDQLTQAAEVNRFGQEVKRAGLQCIDSCVQAAVGGDHRDRHLWVA